MAAQRSGMSAPVAPNSAADLGNAAGPIFHFWSVSLSMSCSFIFFSILLSPLILETNRSVFFFFSTGIAIGINKGHKVTPRVKAARVSYRKGAASARTTFVRDIIQEVAGLAPYERRIIELLRNSQEKRARKLAKKKLGTFGRAKAKVESMTKIIAESRRVAGH